MRLSVRSLRQVVKGDLHIEFGRQDLTSNGGLELVRHDLHRLDLMARRRHAVASVPSDYGGARLALLVIALFYVGARRLEHLRYLAPLIQLNHDLVIEAITRLHLPSLTVGVDGILRRRMTGSLGPPSPGPSHHRRLRYCGASGYSQLSFTHWVHNFSRLARP